MPAAISYGPKWGLLNNASIGEQYFDQLRPFLRGLDDIVSINVKSILLSEPPANPSDGDTYYILYPSPSGAWTGHANQLAVWSSQVTEAGSDTLQPGWDFYTPPTGTVMYWQTTGSLYYVNGSGSFSTLIEGYPIGNQAIVQPTGSNFAFYDPAQSTQLLSISPQQIIVNTGNVLANSVTYTSGTHYLDPGSGDFTTQAPIIIADASAGDVTIDINEPAQQVITIKRHDSSLGSSNTVTITTDGNLIDGASSVTLANYGCITVYGVTVTGGPSPYFAVLNKL